MARNVIWTVIFTLVAVLLQSTLLSRLALYHAVPDLALGILVYCACTNGALAGQLSGFFSGLFLDFISGAPLGLNTFIRTLLGALAGLLKGAFFLDALFLPVILCAAATLLKAGFLFLLHLLLAGAVPAYPLSAPTLWVELMLNGVSAPLLFGLLRLFRPLLLGADFRRTPEGGD
jgi:rod shape-determining protein MreD